MENHSPINVFIAYSSRDEDYLNELRVHLEPLVMYQIVDDIWFDGKIVPGAIWAEVIKEQLDAASIILLLLSPDFLFSHYCQNEMVHALERHEKKTATVVPIIARPCNWKINPQLSRIEAAIKSKIISTAPHRDEVYVQITENIVGIAQEKRKAIELAQLQAQEDAYWQKIKTANRLQDYRIYLETYPNGRYAQNAKRSIQAIEAKEEQVVLARLQQEETNFWEKTKEENTIAAYDQYLKKYQNGKYTTAALNAKQAIQQKILEAARAKDIALKKESEDALRQPTYTPSNKEILVPKMVFVQGGILETHDPNGGTIKSFFFGKNKIKIQDFWIGKYQITNEEYAFFLNRYGSDKVKTGEYKNQTMVEAYGWGVEQQNNQWLPAKGYERHPIVEVTWYGANEYCNWLKQETGENYQLPDEWYWEWAARGGQQSKGYEYAGSNDLNEVAWYDKNSYDKGSNHTDYGTHRVGEKKANELGLYDMSGNVGEWCANWYDKEETYRVLRGGSWYNLARHCRSAYRGGSAPGNRDSTYGFRVVFVPQFII